MTAAGARVSQCSVNPRENRACRSGVCPAGAAGSSPVDGAGEQERPQRRAGHPLQIVKDIRAGQTGHQKRAGGHGGAAVAEIDAREDRTAHQAHIQSHGGAHGRADDPCGSSRAEGGAGQERHGAVEQEGHQKHGPRPDERRGGADQHGNGARRAPQGGEHADEQEGDQDVPHRPDPAQRHPGQRPPGKALPAAVQQEQDEPRAQRPQDGRAGHEAQDEAQAEQTQRQPVHFVTPFSA